MTLPEWKLSEVVSDPGDRGGWRDYQEGIRI